MNPFISALIEKTVATFIQAYLGAWAVFNHDFDHIADTQTLKIAAAAALLAFLMTLLTRLTGNRDSGLWTR